MIWHYNCPSCGQNLEIHWDDHGTEYVCPSCHTSHYPPTPSEDHLAFVGGDRWPHEVEEAVIGLRGTTCDVPGCYHQYETLALRKAASHGGRLSVENLVPMCHHHARLKGEQDYDRWVQGLTPEERAGAVPEIEITFTREEPEPAAPPRPAPAAPPRPAGAFHYIAGRVRVADEHPPEGLHLVIARPVLAARLRRLVFHYCCVLDRDGACRVVLAVWPQARPPDWSKEGFERADIPRADAQHEGERNSRHASRLVLDLSGAAPGLAADGLWTAAVFLQGAGGRPEITDYLLVGED